MDERVRRHAEVLLDHCTDVDAEDDVLVKAPATAEDLVVALHEELGKRGARPMVTWRNPRASRAYLRAVEAEDLRTKDHELAAMAETDVTILVKGARNAAETGDVDPQKGRAASRARQPILEQRLDTRWVITQHPTPADAQRAEMSTAAWAAFVYRAVDRDWSALRERQRRLAERVDRADELRVVSGDDTDLRLSVSGMESLNEDGTENMPGGEVATSPVPDAVDGTVSVDYPVRRGGREISGAWLEFEDGEVVDHGASENEAVLTAALETDAGARRLGELGIGTNRGIDRFTGHLLFDEKMGDTVHVALGQAMEECVPENREFNDSAIHLDMLVDVGENSRVEADGEVIQRDGAFWFEPAFEAQ